MTLINQRPLPLIALIAVTGLLCTAPEPGVPAPPASAPPASGSMAAQRADSLRLDGEFGLWVARYADTVRVAWLTRAAGPGFLQVFQGSNLRHDLNTPGNIAHARAFVHRGGGSLTLRYGAANDAADRHETVIRLDPPRRPAVAFSNVDSIFVMSDIHGEFDTLTAVLRNARVIDARGNWSAGRAHFVLAGDLTDRGRDVIKLLWFLYDLEARAQRAGGRVDILLGNHEVMVMLGDLRYLHRKDTAIAGYHGTTYDHMFHPRRSILGRWLASKPALIRIDDVLFAHGGVSTDYLPFTLESFDDTLRTYTGEELFARWRDSTFVVPLDSAGLARRNDFFWDERSVFWYRGYAQADTLADALAAVLRRYRSSIHVIGHTPASSIRERYGGSLIAVNTVPFGAELLLLVRENEGYHRWRYRSSGPPERIGS